MFEILILIFLAIALILMAYMRTQEQQTIKILARHLIKEYNKTTIFIKIDEIEYAINKKGIAEVWKDTSEYGFPVLMYDYLSHKKREDCDFVCKNYNKILRLAKKSAEEDTRTQDRLKTKKETEEEKHQKCKAELARKVNNTIEDGKLYV